MINNFSYSDVEARLKAFANGHYIIQRYSVGEATDFEQTANPNDSNAAAWPLMHVIHPQVTLSDGEIRFDLEVLFADLPREFEERNTEQVEVLSNLIRLCQDLVAAIKNTPHIFSDSATFESDVRIETIGRARANSVCVTRLTTTIALPYDWNACDIPANFVFGQAGGGGGWPWPFPPTGDWCDKVVYCPVTQYILQELEDKLSFVSVDGVTIIGDGTPSNPLVAIGGGGGGAVTSVNGQTGAVVLNAGDVGAYPDTNPAGFIDAAGAPVQSVNGQTGVVVLGAGDVGADPVGSAAQAEQNANNYTDQQIGAIVFPPPVNGSYSDQAAMIAAQGSQIGQYIYFDGNDYWEYLGTTNGDITDYRQIGSGSGGAFWPLAGTGTGPQANGTIEVDPAFSGDLILQDDGAGNLTSVRLGAAEIDFFWTDGVAFSRAGASQGDAFIISGDGANSSSFLTRLNPYTDAATYPLLNVINQKRWNFNGLAAPTVNDDSTLGYGVDSGFIHDGTLYICTDATTGAAVWVAQGGGGGGSLDLEVNGTPNASQTLLNLVDGTNTVVSDQGAGAVRIDVLPSLIGSSITAVIGGEYINTANATYTDPTATAAWQQYRIRVRSGTATVGGIAYANPGTVIERVWNGTAWTTFIKTKIILGANFTTASNSMVTVTGFNIHLEANANYSIRYAIRHECSGAGGNRFQSVGPAGITTMANTSGRTSALANSANQSLADSVASTQFATQAVVFVPLNIIGSAQTAATAGNITLQVLANTAGQSATVYGDSIFEIERIS
jgi:hypothetical protein